MSVVSVRMSIAVSIFIRGIGSRWLVGIGNDIASDDAAIDLSRVVLVRNDQGPANDRIVTCEILQEIKRIGYCEVSICIGGDISDSTSRGVLIYIWLVILVEFLQWIKLFSSLITDCTVTNFAILLNSDVQVLRCRERSHSSNE